MEQPKPDELEGSSEQNNVESTNTSHRDRSHYRSASWSFTPNPQPITDPSITNPALQIASVLRGFVPAISTQQQGSSRPNTAPVSNSIREMDTAIDMEPARIGLGEAVSSVSSAQTSVSKWCLLVGVFVVLLSTKLLWHHWVGIVLWVGLHLLLYHCNKGLKGQVSLRDKKQPSKLVILMLFLLFNLVLIYYTFSQDHIYVSFYFGLPPMHPSFDFMTTIWVVLVTDYTVRYIVLLVKSAICLLGKPPRLSNRQKGNVYLILEHGSQMYRLMLPTRIWLSYFFHPEDAGMFCSVIISILYLIFKSSSLFLKGKELRTALLDLSRNWAYMYVGRSENGTCPICQEEYTDPVKLLCSHVFCDGCVSIWFDRERTCPLCRTPVASDPQWRDGSTSLLPFFF